MTLSQHLGHDVKKDQHHDRINIVDEDGNVIQIFDEDGNVIQFEHHSK